MHPPCQVVAGQTTETFRRHPMPQLARASFSLVYADAEAGGLRTLDLTCQSELEHELWFWGLQVGAESTGLLSYRVIFTIVLCVTLYFIILGFPRTATAAWPLGTLHLLVSPIAPVLAVLTLQQDQAIGSGILLPKER